jgi:hypothetical protein|tara:strand:- start:211 stop:492 length:282 start_codon:yes stop_codon:yes gene_type:complete
LLTPITPPNSLEGGGFADGNIAEQLYGQTHPARPEQLGLTQIELENSAAPFQAWLKKQERPVPRDKKQSIELLLSLVLTRKVKIYASKAEDCL